MTEGSTISRSRGEAPDPVVRVRHDLRDEADVSVVICACSDERFELLRQAVASVEGQVIRAREIIVVVDHNPDLLARVRTTFPVTLGSSQRTDARASRRQKHGRPSGAGRTGGISRRRCRRQAGLARLAPRGPHARRRAGWRWSGHTSMARWRPPSVAARRIPLGGRMQLPRTARGTHGGQEPDRREHGDQAFGPAGSSAAFVSTWDPSRRRSSACEPRSAGPAKHGSSLRSLESSTSSRRSGAASRTSCGVATGRAWRRRNFAATSAGRMRSRANGSTCVEPCRLQWLADWSTPREATAGAPYARAWS